MTDERVRVVPDEAIARMNIIPDYDNGSGPQPCVHTFRQGPIGILIGAHWTVADIRSHIEKFGCEESGPAATNANHGLVVLDDDGALFLETA